METKKIQFKVGDTVKCINDKIVYRFKTSSANDMFNLNQEYLIKYISSSECIMVHGCDYYYEPKNFVKVLKTNEEKASLLEYQKSVYNSFKGFDYVFDVENVLVNFHLGLITFDLITKSWKPSSIFGETDWKTVHNGYITVLSALEKFEESQKKVNDDIQAQIKAEKELEEKIIAKGREIMAEILKKDKFVGMYTVDSVEDQEKIAKQLFMYFTDHKPQELKTIVGIEKLVSSENNYRCVVVGIPYDTRGGDAGSTLKMFRCVGKRELKLFLNSKIEPSRPVIGLTPIEIRERDFKINRFNEVCEAISRYYNSGKTIPIDWISEYNNLVEFVLKETKQGIEIQQCKETYNHTYNF